MHLDLVDVHGVGPDGLGQYDAVAGGAGLVGGHGVEQLRAVLGEHLVVGAEAAGGHDDGLRVVGDGGAGAQVAGTHAADGAALVAEQLLGLHLRDGRHAALLALGAHVAHEVGAHGAAVLGAVDALDRGAAGGGELGEVHPALLQALEGGVGVLAHEGDEVHVAQLVAALVGVAGEELHAVLDALGLLDLGAAGVHATLGAHGVAAGHCHLLEQQHAGAAVVGAHRGRHACAARADDDDVVGERSVLGGGVGRGVLGVRARDAAGGCGQDAAGEGPGDEAPAA